MVRETRLRVRGRPRPARCPELLRSREVLPRTTARLAPRQRALPLLHRSYELMRQTKFLPVSSVVPMTLGLCRLLSVPAARWPFPALSPQVFLWLLGPLPRWAPTVHLPVTSHRNIGLLCARQIGFPTTPRTAISVRPKISELQSFDHLQAPRLAHHPDRSHRSPSE